MARPTAHTMTAGGNAKVVTAQSKFGGASMSLGNVTTDFVSTPDDTDFTLGNGDFTLECFVRLSQDTNPNQMFYHGWAAGNRGYIFFKKGAENNIEFGYTTDGTTPINVDFAWTDALNTWYHIALSRSGTNLRCFVDGTQVGATYNIGTDTIYDSTAVFKIGGDANSAESVGGWIDEVRVSKIARYTANFTAPSAAFVNDSNTLLLVHCDGIDQSTTFTDDNTTAATAKNLLLVGVGA